MSSVVLDTVNPQIKERYKMVSKFEEAFNVLRSFDELENAIITSN